MNHTRSPYPKLVHDAKIILDNGYRVFVPVTRPQAHGVEFLFYVGRERNSRILDEADYEEMMVGGLIS